MAGAWREMYRREKESRDTHDRLADNLWAIPVRHVNTFLLFTSGRATLRRQPGLTRSVPETSGRGFTPGPSPWSP